jgi:hypothetical protein
MRAWDKIPLHFSGKWKNLAEFMSVFTSMAAIERAPSLVGCVRVLRRAWDAREGFGLSSVLTMRVDEPTCWFKFQKRVGCHKLAARNLRASFLRRQSAKKPVLLTLRIVFLRMISL